MNGDFQKSKHTQKNYKGVVINTDKYDWLYDAYLSDLFDNFNPNFVTFKPGSAELPEDFKTELMDLAEIMERPEYLKYGLQIQGHTDADGDEKTNAILSEKRAKNIRDYLVEEGLMNAERVEYIGFGLHKPLDTNETEEGKEVNRRVEFKLFAINQLKVASNKEEQKEEAVKTVN